MILLARFLSQRVTGGSDRCVDYGVLACDSRQTTHMSPSAYQYGPSNQVGVPNYATFGQLSICGATRRVWIFTELRDLADPEAQQLCIYVKRATEFPAGAEVLPLSARGWGDLLVLG